MGVGSTETEGTNPHHQGSILMGERLQFGLNLQLEAGKINRRIGPEEMQARG